MVIQTIMVSVTEVVTMELDTYILPYLNLTVHYKHPYY